MKTYYVDGVLTCYASWVVGVPEGQDPEDYLTKDPQDIEKYEIVHLEAIDFRLAEEEDED